MADNGLLKPHLNGKRLIAETRLRRSELRVERVIKSVLAQHKGHALHALRTQLITAAAPPDSFGLYSWDTDIDDAVLPEIGDVLGDLATSTFNFLSLPPETRAQVLGAIDVQARSAIFTDKVRTVGTDVAGRLMETLSIGVGRGESIDALSARIEDTFDIGDRIAERIARTETHGAAEATSFDSASAISAAGYEVTKTWIATADDRTRPTHVEADGQTVGIDDSFSVGDSELAYPGDPDGEVEETVNCRCSTTYDLPAAGPADNSDTPDMGEIESENE